MNESISSEKKFPKKKPFAFFKRPSWKDWYTRHSTKHQTWKKMKWLSATAANAAVRPSISIIAAVHPL